MLEPIVEEIAAETDAVVATLDIDTNQRLATEFSVRGVPIQILFADSETAERLMVCRSKTRYSTLSTMPVVIPAIRL